MVSCSHKVRTSQGGIQSREQRVAKGWRLEQLSRAVQCSTHHLKDFASRWQFRVFKKNLSNKLYFYNYILITGFTLHSFNNENKLTMNVEIKKVLWSSFLKIVYHTLTKYCRKLGDISRLLPWSKVNGSGKNQMVKSGLEPCHFVRHLNRLSHELLIFHLPHIQYIFQGAAHWKME